MKLKNVRLVVILALAGSLLLIPYVAMRFTDEVKWDSTDFIAMGSMLLVTGLAIEFALRIFKGAWIRTAAVATVLFGFLMVWGTLVHMGG
ncbi:MAG: hypothetical protein UZ17_ACD001000135 [Acidobacteria bacterium OLB17]|nr:MAG: hypothetical protein UZ17_ACD001000135 [Acidobacteria bacterium OLB17]MCZ2391004.1 hypothetical protein [Acidobacteriota bacterium]